MSAKTDYQALEAALHETEIKIKPEKKSRKHWDPRGLSVPELRAEFRILVKEFWALPSEEDVPSPSNEDLFWGGDSIDRERIVQKLGVILANRGYTSYRELENGWWPWRRRIERRGPSEENE
jgi:hypothetical protein